MLQQIHLIDFSLTGGNVVQLAN